jgi:hypothetical protein
MAQNRCSANNDNNLFTPFCVQPSELNDIPNAAKKSFPLIFSLGKLGAALYSGLYVIQRCINSAPDTSR